ncbi:MAG: hypothetical protein HQK54_16490, partial [Oligoflexales bacterium]|nr:hypothetical protein [Oligoflexales bacterium]
QEVSRLFRGFIRSAVQEESQPSGLCPRGTVVHPATCWRIRDVDELEREIHKEDYSSILKDSPKKINQFGSDLNEIKSIILH